MVETGGIKQGDLFLSTVWFDPGDNQPLIIRVTSVRGERVYWRSVHLYDGNRIDFTSGALYYLDRDKFLAKNLRINLAEVHRRADARKVVMPIRRG